MVLDDLEGVGSAEAPQRLGIRVLPTVLRLPEREAEHTLYRRDKLRREARLFPIHTTGLVREGSIVIIC